MESSELTYLVPGISCAHCVTSITQEVTKVTGVTSVEVDVEEKTVVVQGGGVNDDAVRAAIDEAGYDVAAVA